MNTVDPIYLFAALTKPVQHVYPLYLASRVLRTGLLPAKTDAENIVADVGDIQSLGNSRYAIPVTDTNGTKYRITIEVVS